MWLTLVWAVGRPPAKVEMTYCWAGARVFRNRIATVAGAALMLFSKGNVICDGTTILRASLHSDGNFVARPVEII